MSTKQINGTIVPEKLYQDAAVIIRKGGKAFLALGSLLEVPELPIKPTECANCLANGSIVLQYFSGGPYEQVPGNGEYTWHEGRWFRVETKDYICPVCQGTGHSGQRPGKHRKLAL